MEKTDVIKLIGVKHENDALLQQVAKDQPGREVFCSVKSITRAEWAAAGQRGAKPSVCAVVWADEYNGELTAEFGGRRYGIYRTYQPNPEEVELYLEKKAGV